jgi:hypothetical protein
MSESELAHALARQTADAADARWFTIGPVTAYSGNRLTVTIDGASVANINRCAAYTSPVPGTDTALIAVVRSSSSVQYIAVDKIAP